MKIDAICSKVIKKLVDVEIYTWPPTCMGFAYQPERPTCIISKKDAIKQAKK